MRENGGVKRRDISEEKSRLKRELTSDKNNLEVGPPNVETGEKTRVSNPLGACDYLSPKNYRFDFKTSRISTRSSASGEYFGAGCATASSFFNVLIALITTNRVSATMENTTTV